MDLQCPGPYNRSIAESSVRWSVEGVSIWSYSRCGYAYMRYVALVHTSGESWLEPTSHGGIACTNHRIAGLQMSLLGSIGVADVLLWSRDLAPSARR